MGCEAKAIVGTEGRISLILSTLRIGLTPNVVLQLHRDLFQFAPGGGERWKSADNDIMERRPDSTTVVRFEPVPAHLTKPGTRSDGTFHLKPRSKAPEMTVTRR